MLCQLRSQHTTEGEKREMQPDISDNELKGEAIATLLVFAAIYAFPWFFPYGYYNWNYGF